MTPQEKVEHFAQWMLEETIGKKVIANWMIEHHYPTGHGDTVNELLSNLCATAHEYGVSKARNER